MERTRAPLARCPAARPSAPGGVPFGRALLVIDQGPLRVRETDACEVAFREVEALELRLAEFAKHDLPAYQRWWGATFAREIARQGELRVMLREKTEFLLDVRKRHWASFFGATCPMHLEAGPSAEGFDEAAELEGDAGAPNGFTFRTAREAGLSDDGREERGRESAGESIFEPEYVFDENDGVEDGDDDDDWSGDDESSDEFADILRRGSARSAFSWSRAGGAGANGRTREETAQRRAGAPGSGFHAESATSCAASPAGTDRPARLRDRYRILVRQLHPDLNPEQSDVHRKLWHRVQRAYGEGRLEEMDLLLGLSEAMAGRLSTGYGGQITLHDLRRVVREIQRFATSLREKLADARAHRAWGFASLRDPAGLAKIIAAEFRSDLGRLREGLSRADAEIHRFTAGARARTAEERI